MSLIFEVAAPIVSGCRVSILLNTLIKHFGFGVAGNFAGHLEQAGEAGDFESVAAAAEMPKGIFPWYAPGDESFLGTFPISSTELLMPQPNNGETLRVQIEPELALCCTITRSDGGDIEALTPRWVAAFDDCSWRQDRAAKISHKKNWGAGSKGLSANTIPVGSLADCEQLRLACFLRRGDVVHQYGIDSEIRTYSLFGEALLEWLVDRLNNQKGSPDTPLEDVGALLKASGSTSLIVGVGATRYTTFGESNYVAVGDEAIVVLYDGSITSPGQVADAVSKHCEHKLVGASTLVRKVTQ